MVLLRSLIYTVIFYLGSAMIVIASGLTAIVSERGFHRMVLLWSQWHRVCCRLLLGITSRWEGPRPDGALYAIKHQAIYETIEVVALMGKPPAVIMKSELLNVPLWGRLARRYGMIPVDREGGAVALRAMMRAAEKAIAQGRPIIIFPEGTRVPPGETPPLQSGFAGLYKMLRLPVVPVAVDSGRLLPKGSLRKYPGVVTFQAAEIIPPGLPRGAVETQVHAAMNAMER